MEPSKLPGDSGLPAQALGQGRLDVLGRSLLLGGVLAALGFVLDLGLRAGSASTSWMTAGAIGLVCLALYAALRLGYRRYMIAATVVLCMAGAVAATVKYGSVRAGLNFLYVPAIIIAGLMMSRRALWMTTALCICAIGALTGLEMHGYFSKPAFVAGYRVWMAQALTMIGACGLMYYQKIATEGAIRAYIDETGRRLLAEEQRDQALGRFVGIFKAAPVPVMVMSARTGLVLDLNAAFTRVLGYSRQDVLGILDESLWVNPQARRGQIEALSRQERVQCSLRAHHASGNDVALMVTSELGSGPEDDLIISVLLPDSGLACGALRRRAP